MRSRRDPPGYPEPSAEETLPWPSPMTCHVETLLCLKIVKNSCKKASRRGFRLRIFRLIRAYTSIRPRAVSPQTVWGTLRVRQRGPDAAAGARRPALFDGGQPLAAG